MYKREYVSHALRNKCEIKIYLFVLVSLEFQVTLMDRCCLCHLYPLKIKSKLLHTTTRGTSTEQYLCLL